MPAELSTGVIERIMRGEEVEKPVLQILGTKKIAGNEMDRLRLLISDGRFINSYAMLATQLNHLHSEGKLAEYTIVQVDKYITSVVNKTESGKRVLIVLELTVVSPGAEVGRKIGNPVSYTEGAAQSSSSSASGSGGNSASGSLLSKPAAAAPTNNADSKPKLYNNKQNESALNQTLNTSLTHPVSSLSPYQNRWVIKVRVIAKTQIRHWSNAKGEGKLFSMDLMDDSGEIRATAFRDQVDKFYDLIELDRVYYISKCQIKPANKTFTSIKNDYEMSFTSDTVVQLCEEEDSGIPEITFDLVPIEQIANMEPNATFDTIGICKEIGELNTFTSRTTNKEFKKRDLVLVDASNAAISVSLWGDDAVNFDGHVQPVVLIKGGRLNEFNGSKSISIGSSSIMKINPDIPEGHKLRGWFDNGGGENISNMISTRTGGAGNFNTEWLTFHEARERNLGTGDKPDYFQCKAIIHIVRSQNAFYKACPQADCNKKVIDENNGHYRCERCNAVFPNFKYRLLINMSIGDWTSNRWVTCFSDTAEQLLNRSAQEIGEILENNPSEGEQILSSITFNSYIFKLRCKMEMYGDMQRNKLTVQSVSPIDYKEYNKHLIDSLRELTGVGKN